MNAIYPPEWNNILEAVLENKVPHALFFITPLPHCIEAPLKQLLQLLHCKHSANKEHCGVCPDCLMVHCSAHPDVHWIKQDKIGSGIKIDQIRALQQTVFLTPQRSMRTVIIIEHADKLNTAAANALLKILEEPAAHTHFILIAEQVSTVLPTILSRCQLIRYSAIKEQQLQGLLELGMLYPNDSERFMLAEQAAELINELISLIEKRQDPCNLALRWEQYELSNLLWFLYLVYSQLHYAYIKQLNPSIIAYEALMKLKSLLSPQALFQQLDKIVTNLKKLSHNININHRLALEDLLLDLWSV